MNLVQMQMASMMQKMQGSMDRLVPEEGIPIPTTSPKPSAVHTLYTPPTRTNTILSPIPEGSTPHPTPPTTNSAPFPPRLLGQFAQEQLPIPPSTTSVQQNVAMVPYAAPQPDVNVPSSSHHQYTQHTTPITQTQYYQTHSPHPQPEEQPHLPVPHEHQYPRAYQPQHHNSSHDIMVTNIQQQPRQPTPTNRTNSTEAPYPRQSNEQHVPLTYSNNTTFQTEPQL
jgi:hypothetical protein